MAAGYSTRYLRAIPHPVPSAEKYVNTIDRHRHVFPFLFYILLKHSQETPAEANVSFAMSDTLLSLSSASLINNC